jgi:hypothetical protein
MSPYGRSGVVGNVSRNHPSKTRTRAGGRCSATRSESSWAVRPAQVPGPQTPDRVRVFEGWFRDTLPTTPDLPYGLIHIDSDLYVSAMDVLDFLFSHRRVAEGALIFFDDWNCNRGSLEFGERKAWREIVDKYNVVYSDEGAYALFSHKFIVHSYAAAK